MRAVICLSFLTIYSTVHHDFQMTVADKLVKNDCKDERKEVATTVSKKATTDHIDRKCDRREADLAKTGKKSVATSKDGNHGRRGVSSKVNKKATTACLPEDANDSHESSSAHTQLRNTTVLVQENPDGGVSTIAGCANNDLTEEEQEENNRNNKGGSTDGSMHIQVKVVSTSLIDIPPSL